MKPLIWRWLQKAPLVEKQQAGSFTNKTSAYVGMENKKMDMFIDATRKGYNNYGGGQEVNQPPCLGRYFSILDQQP